MAQAFGGSGLPQIANSFLFDLPNTFARESEDLADLFEGALLAIDEPVSNLDHLGFALGKSL